MKRLIDETDDAFERALLGSVRNDRAPEGGAYEALLSLSAAAANLPGASAVGTAAATHGLEHAALKKASALAAWKWLGIGVVVGGAAGAGIMATRPTHEVPVRAPSALSASATVVAAPSPEPESKAPQKPSASASIIPAPPVVRPRGPSPAPSVAPEPAPRASSQATVASTLAAEAAAIESARRALSQGLPGRTVELLDRYERESPTHVLAPDAQALRIQAEKARGNDALARRLAQRFLSLHPSDPHAERIRRILSDASRP